MITNDAYSNDDGLTLKTVGFETLNGGQFKLSTQLIRPKLSVILRQRRSCTDSFETYPLHKINSFCVAIQQ